MKHLFTTILTTTLALSGCKTTGVVPPETASPQTTPQIPVGSASQIAAASSCAKVNWKDRGKAPIGFIKGMAEAFARSVCKVPGPQPLGSTDKDALALYHLQPTLVDTFTFLTGLAMRESSGHSCEGRDQSAGNTSSETAEAGLWQTSANSVSASPSLRPIAEYYLAHTDQCLNDVFREGDRPCTAQNLRNYGTGEGVVFQQLSKSCPAFATDWAALGIRVIRRHWGPVNSGAVQVLSECKDMFKQIEAVVKKSCP